MERYYSPEPGWNADRNEDGSPIYETFASRDIAEPDYELVELTPAMLARLEAEDEAAAAEAQQLCPARFQIIDEANGTLGEMVAALEAHEARCPYCQTGKPARRAPAPERTIAAKEAA